MATKHLPQAIESSEHRFGMCAASSGLVLNPTEDLLDPRTDVVFKLLLQDEPEVLASLIAAVVDFPGPLHDVEVLNPLHVGEAPDDKNIMLDIIANVPGLGRVNIEMQRARHPGLHERFLFYWAREYGSQLVSGDDYSQLVPVIGILWFDFVAEQDRPFHSVYSLRELTSQQLCSNHLQIHTLELPKLTHAIAAQTLENWSYFFGGTDLERAQAAKRDTMVGRAMEKLRKLSGDEKVRRYAQWRERDELAMGHTIASSREEGRQEGRQEGQRELLAALLTARFGPLPAHFASWLNAATPAELTTLAQNVITATSLEALLRPSSG